MLSYCAELTWIISNLGGIISWYCIDRIYNLHDDRVYQYKVWFSRTLETYDKTSLNIRNHKLVIKTFIISSCNHYATILVLFKLVISFDVLFIDIDSSENSISNSSNLIPCISNMKLTAHFEILEWHKERNYFWNQCQKCSSFKVWNAVGNTCLPTLWWNASHS